MWTKRTLGSSIPKKELIWKVPGLTLFSTHYPGNSGLVFLLSMMSSPCKICSVWSRETACGTLPYLNLKATPSNCHFDIKHGLNYKIMRFHSKGYETTVYSSENAQLGLFITGFHILFRIFHYVPWRSTVPLDTDLSKTLGAVLEFSWRWKFLRSQASLALCKGTDEHSENCENFL